MVNVPVIGEGGVELIVEVAHVVRPLLHPDRRRPVAALLLITHTCIHIAAGRGVNAGQGRGGWRRKRGFCGDVQSGRVL
jgi:hypothetical protein